MRYRTHMDAASRPIRFLHQSRVVEVTGLAPTTTVLSWLREHAGCTGTKEGCNEGDCGACTVAVAERQADGQVLLRNLNACLLYLPALDGKALFTVEDLASGPRGPLHPVQQALVDHHGSQCGFCTPGFVMTMWAQWEQAHCSGQVPSRQEWADALAGNLCRCTGYRPILDAAQASVQQPASNHALDRQALAHALRSVQRAPTQPCLDYIAHDTACGGMRRFTAPTNSDELAAVLQAHPQARVLGGATDVALWTNKAHRDVGHLVYTGSAADLNRAYDEAGWIRIGAATSLETAWSYLARHWPTLDDVWRRFASPPVRHAGTLAGNVANGSPIGDGAPVLMALGARLVLRHGAQRRTVPLENFYLGYQRKDLKAGEFIEWIEIPLPQAGQALRAWKVSKRYDSDISALCGAFDLRFAGSSPGNRVLRAVRIAFGGLAATVQRAQAAEQALITMGWNPDGVQAAQAALLQDFSPLSDLRASAEYRLEAAQALLQRLWWSVEQSTAPQQARALEVWR
jgi:xanthine dehydrogenase small subunit